MVVETKEAAKQEIIKELKRYLFDIHSGKPKEPPTFREFLQKAIMDSINEGIDVCYKNYSNSD